MSDWKIGDEFAPFHPDASHVEPGYRDGWNACYWQADGELDRLRSVVDESRKACAFAAETFEKLRADAQRYRWLRDNCVREVDDYGTLAIKFRCDFENYNDVDTAIDSARKK